MDKDTPQPEHPGGYKPEGRFFDPDLDRVSAAPRATSRADYERDPLLWFERSRRSSRTALIYMTLVPALTVITGSIIALISRAQGGPICDAGHSQWICTRGYEIAFSLIPLGVSLAGTFGAFWITYHKWATYQQWRPWLGIIWVLVPVSLAWMTAFGSLFVLGNG